MVVVSKYHTRRLPEEHFYNAVLCSEGTGFLALPNGVTVEPSEPYPGSERWELDINSIPPSSPTPTPAHHLHLRICCGCRRQLWSTKLLHSYYGHFNLGHSHSQRGMAY